MTADSQPTPRHAEFLVIGAVVISLALHVFLVPPAARWLERAHAPSSEDEMKVRSEVVLPLADWVLMEASSLKSVLEEEPKAEEKEDQEQEELGYIRTSANQASLTSPTDPSFVSDRNTQAAAETIGMADEALPTIDGEDEESLAVADRRYRDGALVDESPTPDANPAIPGGVSGRQANAAQAVPATSADQENVIAEPLPDTPDAIPLPKPNLSLNDRPSEIEEEGEAERLDQLQETPQEAETSEVGEAPPGAPGAPSSPASSTLPLPNRDVEAFQSETHLSKLDGGAKRKGYAAFDAENTPIGRYRKEVSTAVERAWQMRMFGSRDFMGFNVKLTVEFTVNRYGVVENLRVTKRAKNAVLTNETLTSVLEAKIPEMPANVVDELNGGSLPCQFNFRIH